MPQISGYLDPDTSNFIDYEFDELFQIRIQGLGVALDPESDVHQDLEEKIRETLHMLYDTAKGRNVSRAVSFISAMDKKSLIEQLGIIIAEKAKEDLALDVAVRNIQVTTDYMKIGTPHENLVNVVLEVNPDQILHYNEAVGQKLIDLLDEVILRKPVEPPTEETIDFDDCFSAISTNLLSTVPGHVFGNNVANGAGVQSTVKRPIVRRKIWGRGVI